MRLLTTGSAPRASESVWVKHGKTIINHPPVITINICGMVTIPNHGLYGIVLPALRSYIGVRSRPRASNSLNQFVEKSWLRGGEGWKSPFKQNQIPSYNGHLQGEEDKQSLYIYIYSEQSTVQWIMDDVSFIIVQMKEPLGVSLIQYKFFNHRCHATSSTTTTASCKTCSKLLLSRTQGSMICG